MLGKTNASVGSKIKNEDITITENGTYQAKEDYTGLGIVKVEVPAKGNTLTVVNKTGSSIAAGNKVWLNENAFTAGSMLQFTQSSPTTLNPVVIMPDGNYLFKYDSFYHIGTNGLEKVSTLSKGSGGSYVVRVLNNGAVFLQAYGQNYLARIDYPNSWSSVLSLGYLLNENYTFHTSGVIRKINPENGAILYSSTNAITNTSNLYMIGNTIYNLYNTTKYILTDTGSELSFTSGTYNNPAKGNVVPLGGTSDKKYIFALNSTYEYGTFNILKFDEDSETISQAEIPDDIQPFTAKPYCRAFWNPVGQLLVLFDPSAKNYGMFKYDPLTGFSKIPFTLPENVKFSNNSQVIQSYSSLMSADSAGNKVSFVYPVDPQASYSGTSYLISVVNLDTVEGYAAVRYSPYNVSENTLTGYAAEQAAAGAEFTADVAGQPEPEA